MPMETPMQGANSLLVIRYKADY
uniref:Uncharacterized protein n=1 Tax=Anguilla anguilla TaxID=7936 RepID=A0A0E9RUD8_ANGAN